MKKRKKVLSSPHLIILKKEFKKIQKAENYLDKEKSNLLRQKAKIRLKLKKEKEVLRLKNKIKIIRHRKRI